MTTPHSPSPAASTRPFAAGLLLVAVALAFADASVVALALPDVYSELETSITAVSWVLTIYALAVAVTGVALLVLRGRIASRVLVAGGGLVFAGSSAVAGISPSLELLLVSRAAQGVGAAALLMGALDVLRPLTGGRERATRCWAIAGTIGAVLGPAVGGIVTQVFDWRAVFLVQAPVALGAVVAALAAPSVPAAPTAQAVPARRRPGALVADLGLGALFGALVGALFLGVVLLVVVWGLAPIVGAAIVTAIPVGTVAAQLVADRLDPRAAALGGGMLLAGGLATLAFIPGVTPAWAATAFLLCGLGFGLVSTVLGPLAVPGDGGARAAGLSSTARHVGLVVGLVVIAPVLAADVEAAADTAPLPATTVLLDSPVGSIDKVGIALDIRDELADAPKGEMPDLGAPFEGRDGDDVARLRTDLESSVHDVMTRSFRAAFLASAAMALVAGVAGLASVARARSRSAVGPNRSVAKPAVAGVLATSALVAFAVPAVAFAGGGQSVGEFTAEDPCTAPADPRSGSGFDAAAQRFVLSGLNGAACELDTSREELVLSLEPRSGVDVEWDNDTIEDALRSGVSRAIDDADQRDSVPGWIAWSLQAVVERAPISWFLDRVV